MPAFRMRTSKFRHVFGKPFRKELCLENIRITKNAHDGNFCAVNPKLLAVATESSGGGAFLVLPITQAGRVDVNAPKISGHAGAVLDLKWNPFDNNVIASGSDDATVKIWRVPPEGLVSNLNEWQVDLHGHLRRVTYVDWHPTASNILLSAGFDFKCFIWNVEQAEPINVINCHTDTIFSMSWSREGSMFATTSKDKKIRVIDPRSTEVIAETEGHVGNKTSKVVFLEDQRLLTTGFSRRCDRQLAIWDIRNMKESQKMDNVDCSSGVIQPFYDPDIRVVFLAGKGDGNIRYYEITDDGNYFHYLNEYMSNSPQRSLGRMPKLGCDVTKCEIVRFYKIHGSKNLLEPISMIVPRKSEQFQEDIFPPTAGMIPSLTADEWVSGQNREPILVSLQDGQITNTPKVTTSRPAQRQDGALQSNPVITTYTAVSRRSNQPMRRANTIAASTVPNNIPAQEPASLKNIKRLSINEDIVTIEEPSPGLSQRRMMFEQASIQNNNNNNNNNNKANLSGTPYQNSHYEKKVWSPISPPATSSTNGITGSDSEQEFSPFKQDKFLYKQDSYPGKQEQISFRQDLPSYNQGRLSYSPDIPSYKQDIPSYQKDIPSYKKDIPSYKQDIPSYQKDIPSFQKDIPSYKQDIPSYQQDIPSYKQDIPSYKQDIPGYKQDIPSYQKDIPSYQKDIPSYKQDIPGYKPDLPFFKQDISSYQKDIPQFKKEISPYPRGISPFQKDIPLYKQEESLKQDTSPYKQDILPFSQDMTPVKQDKPLFQQEKSPYKPDISPLKQDISPYKQDISPYKQDISPFKQEVAPFTQVISPYAKEVSQFKQDLPPLKPNGKEGIELSAPSAPDSVESDVMEWRSNAAYQRRKRPLSTNMSPSNSESSCNSLAKLVIGEPSSQSQSNKIHVRKVWHMQSFPSPSVPTDHNGHNFQTDIELKKAYFRQQEEIRSLQEQLRLKDKRINQLEDEIDRLKGVATDHSESNC